MDNILATILKDTFTTSSLQHRLGVLKSYLLNAIFGGPQNAQIDQTDLNWLSSLPPGFLQNFNKDNIYQIFDELQNKIQLPSLTIYLPIEATDNTCLQIGSFARKTLGKPQLLLDAKFDPTLIAGCALAWKGVYRDYSLRARIAERKEEVLAGFKKFLS